MQKIPYTLLALLLFLVLTSSDCKQEQPPVDSGDIIDGVYAPQAYDLELPSWLGAPYIPADNPMTVDGVELGRHLFYDPLLSADNTMSCSSCHLQAKNFADGLAVSTGIDGIAGRRSSMPLINLAYNTKGFFWDGRAASLEQQALAPVEDPVELHNTWPEVVQRLQEHDTYPTMFRKAFGIEKKQEITKELAAKALAQFERSLISFNSRYDKVVWENQGFPTDSEERGKQLFFIEESQTEEHPGCSHCHVSTHFTDNTYKNNGLDNPGDLNNYSDKGRGEVTGNLYDNGRFRVPTLRNIALSAPYMHDGRFATLEEVLQHYAEGGHGAENEDVNIMPFTLNDQQIADMVAFLNMLTDTTFTNDERFSSPFE